MGKKIELGKAHSVGIISQPETVHERIQLLEDRLTLLTQAFNAVNSTITKDDLLPSSMHEDPNEDLNKDGIPLGLSLLGQSTRGGIYVLSVRYNKYCIGTTEYESLSAAAEAASGVRRSGWTFWKLPDGRTVKEVFGN